MIRNLKMAALGVAATVGLAAAGVFAQETDAPRTPANPQMDQQMMRDGGKMGDGMMAMMNDPEMRHEMTEMMKNCNRMMERMADMSEMGQTRPSGSKEGEVPQN